MNRLADDVGIELRDGIGDLAQPLVSLLRNSRERQRFDGRDYLLLKVHQQLSEPAKQALFEFSKQEVRRILAELTDVGIGEIEILEFIRHALNLPAEAVKNRLHFYWWLNLRDRLQRGNESVGRRKANCGGGG